MQVIAEAAVGRPTLGNAAWISITAVIVAAAYAVAIAVPNIWPVMVSPLPKPLCTSESVAVVHTAPARASAATGMNVLFSVTNTFFWQCPVGPTLGCPADYYGSYCSCGHWVDLPCMHHAEDVWRQMLMAEEAWRLSHHPVGPVDSCGSGAQHHRRSDPPVSLALGRDALRETPIMGGPCTTVYLWHSQA